MDKTGKWRGSNPGSSRNNYSTDFRYSTHVLNTVFCISFRKKKILDCPICFKHEKPIENIWLLFFFLNWYSRLNCKKSYQWNLRFCLMWLGVSWTLTIKVLHTFNIHTLNRYQKYTYKTQKRLGISEISMELSNIGMDFPNLVWGYPFWIHRHCTIALTMYLVLLICSFQNLNYTPCAVT